MLFSPPRKLLHNSIHAQDAPGRLAAQEALLDAPEKKDKKDKGPGTSNCIYDVTLVDPKCVPTAFIDIAGSKTSNHSAE